MKNFFLSLVFLTIIFSTGTLNAQVLTKDGKPANSCTEVTEANWGACCSRDIDRQVNQELCRSYCPGSDIASDGEYRDCCDAKNYPANQNKCDRYQKSHPPRETPVAPANTCPDIRTDSLLNILAWVKCLIRQGFIPIIFSLSFIFVLVAAFRVISEKDSKKQAEYKQALLWAVIGLFVMVSIWGLVSIVSQTFGLESRGVIPTLQVKP